LLSNPIDRTYAADLAGSGFVADVTTMPTNVSFERIEVREETAKGFAIGYYDDRLDWNGLVHPQGSWNPIDAANDGIIDSVGTDWPGTPRPFSSGTFLWTIPLSYRPIGDSGDGFPFGANLQVQVMDGTIGAETTFKQGASRSRRPIPPAPTPAPAPGATPPSPPPPVP
jgi:hypothetical protein